MSSGKVLGGNEITFTETGGIVVKSNSLFKGYFKKETKYTGSFLTGDQGFLDENGYIYIQSRREDLIISGGENVETREVLNAINSFGSVTGSYVFSEKSDKWGQTICAAVSLNDFKNDVYSRFKKHLRKNLAAYKIPKKIYLFSKIPKNEIGKVLLNEKELSRALFVLEEI
jgi:o-succinylbenzoate---CoA ligase